MEFHTSKNLILIHLLGTMAKLVVLLSQLKHKTRIKKSNKRNQPVKIKSSMQKTFCLNTKSFDNFPFTILLNLLWRLLI